VNQNGIKSKYRVQTVWLHRRLGRLGGLHHDTMRLVEPVWINFKFKILCWIMCELMGPT
jgi:hypothetical protein